MRHKEPREIFNEIKEGKMDQWDLENEIEKIKDSSFDEGYQEGQDEYECDGDCDTSYELQKEVEDLEDQLEKIGIGSDRQLKELRYLIKQILDKKDVPEEIKLTQAQITLLEDIYYGNS